MKAEEFLQVMDDELGEWKEQLGGEYPSFLNHVLANKLMKAYDHIEYLEKCRKVAI